MPSTQHGCNVHEMDNSWSKNHCPFEGSLMVLAEGFSRICIIITSIPT